MDSDCEYYEYLSAGNYLTDEEYSEKSNNWPLYHKFWNQIYDGDNLPTIIESKNSHQKEDYIIRKNYYLSHFIHPDTQKLLQIIVRDCEENPLSQYWYKIQIIYFEFYYFRNK